MAFLGASSLFFLFQQCFHLSKQLIIMHWLTKESVNAAGKPWLDGLFEEAYLFEQLLRTPEARENMRRFLELGGQTREGELAMGELCARLGRDR